MKMNTYTLEQELYDGYFIPKFAFNAKSDNDALGKAYSWGFYHGHSPSKIRVRKATKNEATNWMHNEYIELTN